MEPDLILHPILERAAPSLEALNEVCNSKPVFSRVVEHPYVRLSGQLRSSKPWEQLRRQLFPEKSITQEGNILYLYCSSLSRASILYALQ
jgi:hypothetical protein